MLVFKNPNLDDWFWFFLLSIFGCTFLSEKSKEYIKILIGCYLILKRTKYQKISHED